MNKFAKLIVVIGFLCIAYAFTIIAIWPQEPTINFLAGIASTASGVFLSVGYRDWWKNRSAKRPEIQPVDGKLSFTAWVKPGVLSVSLTPSCLLWMLEHNDRVLNLAITPEMHADLTPPEDWASTGN